MEGRKKESGEVCVCVFSPLLSPVFMPLCRGGLVDEAAPSVCVVHGGAHGSGASRRSVPCSGCGSGHGDAPAWFPGSRAMSRPGPPTPRASETGRLPWCYPPEPGTEARTGRRLVPVSEAKGASVEEPRSSTDSEPCPTHTGQRTRSVPWRRFGVPANIVGGRCVVTQRLGDSALAMLARGLSSLCFRIRPPVFNAWPTPHLMPCRIHPELAKGHHVMPDEARWM